MKCRKSCMGVAMLVLLGVMSMGCGTKESADLVLFNGKIVTIDQALPEAEALAIVGDRILALGTDELIQEHIADNTDVIDLEGRLAVPGLIDAHAHFMSLGRAMTRLRLGEVTRWDDVIEMVADAAKNAEPGEWILGRGWHQEKWSEVPEPNVDGLPIHDALSAVSPDNPVHLRHASGHSSFANAKAMEVAGVDASTSDPDGGEIVRDAGGDPIGVFRETAQELIQRAEGGYDEHSAVDQSDATLRRIAELAERECLAKGITSFHDAGVSFQTVDFFKQLVADGELGIRLYAMLSEDNEQLAAHAADYRIIGFGNNHLTVCSIKRLIDGALGSHGAWLLEPYESLPTSTGLNTEPVDVMRETARIAMEHGFQLCTHAIGDRGNRETLDIYEEAFEAHPEAQDLRWRIEHSQHLSAEDIPRFGELGVIASMQGIHCTSDAPWVYKRLGAARAEEGAYVWRKLMDSGAMICNGTDAPVEDVDPIQNFYALVTRQTKHGDRFFPEQVMTRDEALRSYTINAARAAFEEDLKGSLIPGKLADITVLSKDILTVADDEILDAEVVYTIVGGEVLYQRSGL